MLVYNGTRKGILFLVLLFNHMLRIHHFPTHRKCAVISMIPKPGKPENLVASYRPISLLLTFSKIFEKIFLSRMMAVRRVQDAIPDHQFGFRSHHDTPEQVHRVTQHSLQVFENKLYSPAVYLDVKGDFIYLFIYFISPTEFLYWLLEHFNNLSYVLKFTK